MKKILIILSIILTLMVSTCQASLCNLTAQGFYNSYKTLAKNYSAGEIKPRNFEKFSDKVYNFEVELNGFVHDCGIFVDEKGYVFAVIVDDKIKSNNTGKGSSKLLLYAMWAAGLSKSEINSLMDANKLKSIPSSEGEMAETTLKRQNSNTTLHVTWWLIKESNTARMIISDRTMSL